MIRFGIIGAGWRSEFYLRIASRLPERFYVTGIYIRNEKKRAEFLQKYNVKIVECPNDLFNTSPDFIVSCVNKDSCCEMITELCSKGIPVLSETPVGTSFAQIETFEKGMNKNWKVQIAEQFHFQPRNQAYKSIVKSGLLGTVHQVQLSCCHDYHAVSLIRFFLDLKDELPKITTVTLPDPLNTYNFRSGKFNRSAERITTQQISVLQFKEKSAIYDFNCEQYFSDIRASRICIRGTKGEIVNDTCTYLQDTTPISFQINRNVAGINENLDGLYLDNIVGNGGILYKNTFGTARLSDEEIAIATCLEKMKEYVDRQTEFYSIQDAIIDTKISLFMTAAQK